MQNPNLLVVALAHVLLASPAHAQIPRGNPLVDASHAIGTTGLGSATSNDRTATTFKPSGKRTYVKEFASHLGSDAAKQAEIEQGILAVMGVYEEKVKEAGMANDLAVALAFSVDELYAVKRGEEIDAESFKALIPRFRAVLAKADATDAQKQQYYEYALSCAGAAMTLNASDAAEDKERAKSLSGLLIEALVGAKESTISLDGPNVEIRALEGQNEETPVAKAEPTPEAARPEAAVGGNVLGEWRWISTGSVTNWNMSTGAYAGAGRGMTKRYVFHSDGTFTQDALIQVNNSGHASSVYITAKGRYRIHGDNIEFIASEGHLHGTDNMISSGNYDKPMPDSTVRTAVSGTYRFSVKRVDGKLAFVLHLGSQPKDDMIYVDCRGK